MRTCSSQIAYIDFIDYIHKEQDMWKCKHCGKEFVFETISEKANHSRWCIKNPKRNDTQNLKLAQKKINNEKLGKIKYFPVRCHNCDKVFKVNEREKQFPKKEKYFCCKGCANTQGGKAKAQKLEDSGNMNYTSIAKRNHKQECIVCGFDKIIEAHHINENHDDNRPENLVFLCPNHHKMYHSRFKDEIVAYIKEYQNRRK